MIRPQRIIAIIVVILGMGAVSGFLYSRWQHLVEERDFRATIPADHYEIAQRLLNPWKYRRYHPEPKELAVRWVRERENDLRTRDDVKAAVRHLEAIPASAPEYKPADELLPYLRALLYQPQEYQAMVGARVESCVAAMRAPLEAENKAAGRCVHGIPDPETEECRIMFCGNAVWEGCKPLNDLPAFLTPGMLQDHVPRWTLQK